MRNNAAETLFEAATKDIEGDPSGTIVFDCATRLRLLGSDYPKETKAFGAGQSAPLLGMTCYGEIAEFGGAIEGFHNSTAVVATWK